MIPLHLKISGIYSFRHLQEIDFTRLTAAHLFGIFGAVGSGKSAILEAIIYALYGETDRLSTKVSYNMMNLKSNEAFIEFDFLASGEEGRYRAVVKSKRNGRKFEEVPTPSRSLYKIEGSNLIPLETKRIDQILGISYENFRRTIIIPQGKFQEFIQLSSTQRSTMVKELFNLQKFDLAVKTNLLIERNKQAISGCEGRLLQIGQVSEEDIVVKQEELHGLIMNLQQAVISRKEEEARLKELQQQGEWHASLVSCRKTLSELEAQKEDIRLAAQHLEDFDECVNNFKSDFGILDNTKERLRSIQLDLSKKETESALEQEKLILAEKTLQRAKAGFEIRETLLKKADEFDTCAKVNQLTKALAELTGRISTGEIKVNEARKNRESLVSLAWEFSSLRDTIKSRRPDRKKLQEAASWYASEKLLKERFTNQQQAVSFISDEIYTLLTELVNIGSQVDGEQPEITSIESLLPQELASRKQLAEKQLIDVQQLQLGLDVKDQMKSFASGIQEGIPCPLCGSKEHPHIIQAEDVEKELIEIRERRKALEKELESLNNSITRCSILLDTNWKKRKLLEDATSTLKQAEKAWQNHQETFTWEGLTEGLLEEERKQYDLLALESEKLDAQVLEANGKAEAELKNLNEFTALLESLRLEAAMVHQNAETLRSQISLLDYTSYAGTTAEVLISESEKLRNEYIAIGAEYLIADTEYKKLSESVLSMDVTIRNSRKSIEELSASVTEQQKQLEARILSSRFGNETRVREILALTIDRQREQEKIRQFRERLSIASASVKDLEQKLHGIVYNAEEHQKLKNEIAVSLNRENQLNQLKIAAEIELTRLRTALLDSAIIQEELKQLNIRQENLRTLSELFRAQGFVNYVSTIHLQNLVRGANERFYRLTRQQLKLELDEENNFRVRDYLNEGKWRHVKTLSGGQTFQAALCLALALADNIQQLNQHGQNFFFLDEGFGTLDRESLDLVFETLKSLRRENRIVGVISHVEELQQEIGAWLKIIRDEEYGSLVKANWE